MLKQGFIKILGLYREAISRGGRNGLSMRLRLFLFLILFLNTIMLGVLLILFLSGVFKTGLREHRPVLESELTHIAQDIYKAFGSVSVQATDLAKELSTELERNLKDHGSSAASLQEKPDPATKTKIPEIDDLIEFLAVQDELTVSGEKKERPPQEQLAMYQEFVKNIKLLSVAEKTVFDLYVQGHTANEIADILFLSINTIKTHNRRIYMKLNVTSRKELMVYIKMMEEISCTQTHPSP